MFGKEKIRETAQQYYDKGINIVPVQGKKPLVQWRLWLHQRQTNREFESIPWHKSTGFAVICGMPIENCFLAVVDFDVKNLPQEIVELGREALSYMPITQFEQTPSGGIHYVYFSREKTRTISAYHNNCALELLGENKICLMAPSEGYTRLNDNTPRIVQNIETVFYNTIEKTGVKVRRTLQQHRCKQCMQPLLVTGKAYHGQQPPCLKALMTGVKEGLRNEVAIRIASYLINFKKLNQEKAWNTLHKWNQRNKPPLDRQELYSIFDSALKSNYCFGCEDSLLVRFCNESECRILQRRINRFQHEVDEL